MCQVIVYITAWPRGDHVGAVLTNQRAVLPSRDANRANGTGVMKGSWRWRRSGSRVESEGSFCWRQCEMKYSFQLAVVCALKLKTGRYVDTGYTALYALCQSLLHTLGYTQNGSNSSLTASCVTYIFINALNLLFKRKYHLQHETRKWLYLPKYLVPVG